VKRSVASGQESVLSQTAMAAVLVTPVDENVPAMVKRAKPVGASYAPRGGA
jgi:hypothetical protein